MVAAFGKYGLPFVEQNVPLKILCENMQKFGILDMVIYRIPAAYYLMGQHDEARDYLNKILEKQQDRKDPAAQNFKEFSTKLLAQMN